MDFFNVHDPKNKLNHVTPPYEVGKPFGDGSKPNEFFDPEYMNKGPHIGVAYHAHKDSTNEYAKLDAHRKELVEGKRFI